MGEGKKRQGSNKRHRQMMLATRVTAEESAAVQGAAGRLGVSVAAFIRDAAVQAADRVGQPLTASEAGTGADRGRG